MNKPKLNRNDIINAVVESARQKFNAAQELRNARKKVLVAKIEALALKSYQKAKPTVSIGWNSDHAHVMFKVQNKQIEKLSEELGEISGHYFDEKRVRRNALVSLSEKAKKIIDAEVEKSIDKLLS